MSDEPKEFDVRDERRMAETRWTAESLPKIEVVAAEVPPDLTSYVEKWAISCDVRRGDYYDKQNKEDRLAFHRAVAASEEALNRWIDTPPLKGAKLQFLSMMKAYGEVGCEIAYDERQARKPNPAHALDGGILFLVLHGTSLPRRQ